MAQVLSGRSAEWEQCQNHPTKDRKLIFPQPNKWSHFLTKPDGCLLSISRNEHLALHRVVRTQLLNSSAHVPSFDPSFSSRTHSSLLSSYTVLFISLLNFFFPEQSQYLLQLINSSFTQVSGQAPLSWFNSWVQLQENLKKYLHVALCTEVLQYFNKYRKGGKEGGTGNQLRKPLSCGGRK